MVESCSLVQKFLETILFPAIFLIFSERRVRDKKGKIWLRIRKEKIAEFERLGITQCELRWDGCWGGSGLTLAHRLKRRKIQNEQEMGTVALLCVICHQKVEVMSADEMFKIITDVIERREGIRSMFDE